MRNRRSLSCIILAITACAGSAQAQNALGDGRGLENRGPGARPPASDYNALGDGRALENRGPAARPPLAHTGRRNLAMELAFRESIVSGTAAAGMSFRGDGLPSRFEFRGTLGDDTLHSFRRDSLYSGLASRGLRGTDALQYQMALTTGGQVPTALTGPLSYARAGAAERGVEPQFPLEREIGQPSEGLRRADPDAMQYALDAGSPLVQPVRLLSTHATDRAMQPTLVGIVQDRQTQQAFGQTASPLLGVQYVPINQLRVPSDFRVTRADIDAAANADPADLLTPSNAYEELLQRYRVQAGLPASPSADEANAGLPEWAKDIRSVHSFLRGLPAETAQAVGVTPPDPDPTDAGAAGRLEESGIDGPVDPADVTPRDSDSVFSMDAIRRIRDAGTVAETLVPSNLPRVDRYQAFMRGGQDLLAKEFYFDAEERFISAMASRPNDVPASVGRAHAQLGAGLYLSAATNIRQLFFKHPEVVAMRYGPELLPSPARQAYLVEEFRTSIDSPIAGSRCGLLLAYLGHQSGDEADIRDGLDAVTAWGDDAEIRLATMLRAVWLDEEPPAAEDTETAPAPAPDPGEGG